MMKRQLSGVDSDQLVELQLIRSVAQHPHLKIGGRVGGAAVAGDRRLVVVQDLNQRIRERSGRWNVGEALHLVPLCNPSEGAGQSRAGTVFEDGDKAGSGDCTQQPRDGDCRATLVGRGHLGREHEKSREK